MNPAKREGVHSLWSANVTSEVDPFHSVHTSANMRNQIDDGIPRSEADQRQVATFKAKPEPATYRSKRHKPKIRMNEPNCPNLVNHTSLPDGYIDRAETKERLSETHQETQCPGCGLWAIWVPK